MATDDNERDASIFAFFAGAQEGGDDFNVPFKDAIEYHRNKVNVPTKTWRDVDGQMHDIAFVVAGAQKEQLLEDLNKAVEDAIAKGETLETFTTKYEEAARKAGWLQDQKAAVRAWRARLAYEINLRVAYQAGSYKQMTAPSVVAVRPYWQYIHGDLREPKTPRPMHLSWDGIVLPWDDPWWKTHFAPNGWLCSCGQRPLSKRDLKRKGLSVGVAPQDGMHSYTEPATGEVKQVPMGIDPGWDHAPGALWVERYAPQPASGKAKDFAGKSSRTGATRIEADAIGAPLVLAESSFAGLNPRERDLVMKALRDPDEIALCFAPAPTSPAILTRLYRRGPVEVRWSRDVWGWSQGGEPTAGVVVWRRGDDRSAT